MADEKLICGCGGKIAITTTPLGDKLPEDGIPCQYNFCCYDSPFIHCSAKTIIIETSLAEAIAAFKRTTRTDIKQDICKWKHDKFNNCYDTICGEACCMTEGTPKENKYKFCPFCGKEIEVMK